MAQTKILKGQIQSVDSSQVEGYTPVSVTDSSEIDFTLTGQDITASLKTTGVGAASYYKPTITVDSKGRITSATDNVDITPAGLINVLAQKGSVIYCEFLNASTFGDFRPTGIAAGTITKAATESGHPGMMTLGSSINPNSGYALTSDTVNTDIILRGGEKCIAIIKTPTSFTGQVLRVGFIDNVSGTSTDASYIGYDNSGAVVGTNYNNTATSSTATITTLSTSTWYRLEVEVNSNATSVAFSVYNATGTLIATSSLGTNIPTGAGRTLAAGISSYFVTGGAGVNCLLDFLAVSFGGLTR